MKTANEDRNGRFDLVHRKLFSDHAGRADPHIFRRHVQSLGRQSGHPYGILVSPASGTGIGISAVHENGPALSTTQPLAVPDYWCGDDLVGREDAGHHRFFLGDDQREVGRLALLDAGGYPGSQDAGHGGDATCDDVHHGYRPESCNPSVSSQPCIRLNAWMAWPAAPFTRLSRAAMRIA